MEVIFIDPIYKEYIWGGTRLEKEYNKKNKNRNVAESIEIIVNKDETVKVKNGEFKGKTLFELFQDIYLKEKIFGRYCINRKDFPIIIKFIDAEENLSIQVHPSDIMNEKNELWYIVESSKKSQVIAGFNNNLKKKEFIELLKDNQITDKLNYLDINEGDSIYIPAGTIHSILKNVVILEIQQNSNITYRLFDWNRVDKNGKSRELHIEKAIENIKFSKKAKKYQSNSYKGTNRIIKNKFFDVKKIVVKDKFESSSNINILLIMNVIKGNGKIYNSNNEYILNKGDTFIIPATMGKYKIIGNLEMIRTSLVKEKIKVERNYNI